jgi:peroxiredoxin
MSHIAPFTLALQAGIVAPDFTLQATRDQQLSLAELRGRPVILAFYPPTGGICVDGAKGQDHAA